MNENPRCCGVDICNIKLNTGYERVERKWIVVEGEGELRTYHIYEVEVHGIWGDREVKGVPCLFCVEGVSEDVLGPNGDVCGVIDFYQFLPFKEHCAAVVIVICDYGPPFCDGT